MRERAAQCIRDCIGVCEGRFLYPVFFAKIEEGLKPSSKDEKFDVVVVILYLFSSALFEFVSINES